jgi:hypothetical protein
MGGVMGTTLQFGPPRRFGEWQAFFQADRLSLEDFNALLAAEGPGTSLLTIESMINNLYWWVERARRAKNPILPKLLNEVQYKADWFATRSREMRHSLGPLQRELDLNTLKLIRGSACLAVVIGAGATIAAGGPSWPELVSRLLIRALERGHEIDKARATHIIAAIKQGTADTELLMQGAQLCHEPRGRHLFADITGLLYENDRKPSAVHNAIAELARPIRLRDPERRGFHPGWERIISYNFDDLMGEALDARGILRCVHVTNTKMKMVAAYLSKRAREAGTDEPVLDIFHIHGHTPRPPKLITDIQFVFSASQYQSIYEGRKSSVSPESSTTCSSSLSLGLCTTHCMWVVRSRTR